MEHSPLVKELAHHTTFSSSLLALINRLHSLPYSCVSRAQSLLIALICQSKNLLNYKQLEQRGIGERCLLAIEDLFGRWIKQIGESGEHIVSELLSHSGHHPTCYINHAFLFLIIRKHPHTVKFINYEKLKKIHSKLIGVSEEAGEIKFVQALIWSKQTVSLNTAKEMLEGFLRKKSKPYKQIPSDISETSSITHSKIPPLILPTSAKSITSSRYSNCGQISESKLKGIAQLRKLASSVGQTFVAVELGCLLSHKRTLQAQQFCDNSQFRTRCIEQAQEYTSRHSRHNTSRLSYHPQHSSPPPTLKQEETTKRYAKKMMLINWNLMYLKVKEQIQSQNYDGIKAREMSRDIVQLGIVGGFRLERVRLSEDESTGYPNGANFQRIEENSMPQDDDFIFQSIKVPLKTISSVLAPILAHLNFLQQKIHISLLSNRNRKPTSTHHIEPQFSQSEISDDLLGDSIRLIKCEHLSDVKGGWKADKVKIEKEKADSLILYLVQLMHKLMTCCSMDNTKFYKYQTNILTALASYLACSHSPTAIFSVLEYTFPTLLLLKREMMELSLPFISQYEAKYSEDDDELSLMMRSGKSRESGCSSATITKPLIVSHPRLLTSYLHLLTHLLTSNKHVQKLFSSCFIRNALFLKLISFHTRNLFRINEQHEQNESEHIDINTKGNYNSTYTYNSNLLQGEILVVLGFYKKCVEIYHGRKMRNQDSKSIKSIFISLAEFFQPKQGCIARLLMRSSHQISPSSTAFSKDSQSSSFLHGVLTFIRDVYYYANYDLSPLLLEEEIFSFYLKFCLISFIKLYSFLTVTELIALQQDKNGTEMVTTKESPHGKEGGNGNTVYMLDFVRIMQSLAINRTPEIARKFKQYRILELFVRELELQFCVKQNIQKYIKKVAKIREVPSKNLTEGDESSSNPHPNRKKIPSLDLKGEAFKSKTVVTEQVDSRQGARQQSKGKKISIPSLKIPTKSERSSDAPTKKNYLDDMLDKISGKSIQKPKIPEFSLNLQLPLSRPSPSKQNMSSPSTQRDLIYSSQRRIRKLYSNRPLHAESILLVLSLLLDGSRGVLDEDYCDQFPITHGKCNILYILHHHLNQDENRSVIPLLADIVSRIKPFLAGMRLLKLLAGYFTDLGGLGPWNKLSSGAYGVIYSCESGLPSPKYLAIKQMSLPKSIYQRCVLHDIFTEITCLETFRLEDRVTRMYNYGVLPTSYVIVMKRYNYSLREYVLRLKDNRSYSGNILIQKYLPHLLGIYRQILAAVKMMHDNHVGHYDLKADNILLEVEGEEEENAIDEPSMSSEQEQPKKVKVVLGDFGQCKIFHPEHEEFDTKSRGTECIKSPQMLTLALQTKKQSDTFDRRKKLGTSRSSDIWSLGCLFFQLLTGEYLFHKSDWVNFYVKVTSQGEEAVDEVTINKMGGRLELVQFLRFILVREASHRPGISSVITKFESLCSKSIESENKQKPRISHKTANLDYHLSQYLQIISSASVTHHSPSRPRLLLPSSAAPLKIMDDIFYLPSVPSSSSSRYLEQHLRKLGITHVVATCSLPWLKKYNTLRIQMKEGIDPVQLAVRLTPRISDILREVLLLKGKLLLINDHAYASILPMFLHLLSYWFRCPLFETISLLNTQILLFPPFPPLPPLARALQILQKVEQSVEQLPKLQCICGTVTIILRKKTKESKQIRMCKCRRRKGEINGECPSYGCYNYLQLLRKRYNISWEFIKWCSITPSHLLMPLLSTNPPSSLISPLILSSTPPTQQNLTQSPLAPYQLLSCRMCGMLMLALNPQTQQIKLVMNNQIKRGRQGIMVPNAQQGYGMATPALNAFTLGKLHMTCQ